MMGEGGKRRAGKALMVAVRNKWVAGGTGRLWNLLMFRRNAVGVWRYGGGVVWHAFCVVAWIQNVTFLRNTFVLSVLHLAAPWLDAAG